MSSNLELLKLKSFYAILIGWKNLVSVDNTLLGTPPDGAENSRGQAVVPDWTGDWAAASELMYSKGISVSIKKDGAYTYISIFTPNETSASKSSWYVTDNWNNSVDERTWYRAQCLRVAISFEIATMYDASNVDECVRIEERFEKMVLNGKPFFIVDLSLLKST